MPEAMAALPDSRVWPPAVIVALRRDQVDRLGHAQELIAAAIGTRNFGGKRVWRDEDEKLCFSVRWAILVATKPS